MLEFTVYSGRLQNRIFSSHLARVARPSLAKGIGRRLWHRGSCWALRHSGVSGSNRPPSTRRFSGFGKTHWGRCTAAYCGLPSASRFWTWKWARNWLICVTFRAKLWIWKFEIAYFSRKCRSLLVPNVVKFDSWTRKTSVTLARVAMRTSKKSNSWLTKNPWISLRSLLLLLSAFRSLEKMLKQVCFAQKKYIRFHN